MLDPWIIEQIRRREEEERHHRERPSLEIQVPRDDRPPPSRDSGRQGNRGSDRDRGVVILDYSI